MYACNIDTDNGESTNKDVYRIQFENSPMVAACEGGYIDIVECLVDYVNYVFIAIFTCSM
jgi:hypothetical protein